MTELILPDLGELLDAITPADMGFDPAATGLDSTALAAVMAFLSNYAMEKRTNAPGKSWDKLGIMLRYWGYIGVAGSPAPYPQLETAARAFRAAVEADEEMDQRRQLPDELRILERPRDVLHNTLSRAGRTITAADFNAAWQMLKLERRELVLPGEILAFLLPVAYWPAVWALIQDGPHLAAQRCDLWLAAYAAGRRQSSLEDRRRNAHRAFHTLHGLQAHPSGAFAAWTESPTLIKPKATVRTPMLVGNPDLRSFRLGVWRARRNFCDALSQALPGRRPKGPGAFGAPVIKPRVEFGQELELLERLSKKQAAKIFALARDWAVAHALWELQGRQRAVRNLKIGHLQMQRTGAGEWLTLEYRPEKTKPEDEISPKPLRHPGAVYPMQVVIRLLELYHERPADPSWAMFPPGIRTPEKHYSSEGLTNLLGGQLKKAKHWHRKGDEAGPEKFARVIEREREAAAREGRAPRLRGWFVVRTVYNGKPRDERIWLDATKRDEDGEEVIYYGIGRQALLPKDGPYEGWNPHSIRRLGSQSLDMPRVRQSLIDRNFVHKQEYLSEVLQDHENETTKAVYKQPPEIRHQIAAMAIDVLTDLLYGDLGARMVPDAKRYRFALRELRGLEALAAQLKEQRADLRDQLRAGALSGDQYAAARDEVGDRLEELAHPLARLELEIERIERNEESLRVAVPDRVPDESAWVDLEAVKREVLGAGIHEPGAGGGRKRFWVTATAELSFVAARTTKAVRGWTREKNPTTPHGTPVFLTSKPPVVYLSDKRGIIPWEAFNPEWLDEVPGRRARMELLLRQAVREEKWGAFDQPRYPLPRWLIDELEAAGVPMHWPVAEDAGGDAVVDDAATPDAAKR